MKRIIFIYIFIVLVLSANAAHLIENVSYKEGVLNFDVKSENLFISLYTKDMKLVKSLVNKKNSVSMDIQRESVDGYNLVAVDFNNDVKFESFGFTGVSQGQFRSPRGIYLDYFGKIFVADTMNERIQIFDNNGNFKFEFGNFGWSSSINELKGQFNKPGDIAVNRFIYVSDTDNHRVAKFDIDGNFILSWGGNGSDNGKMYFPKGIALDLSGDVYIADTQNDRIQKFDGNGNFITSFGNFGRGLKQFNKPGYIAVDYDYNIYITDTKNNRIHMYDRFFGFKKYLKFGEKYIKSPEGISVLINLVSVLSSRNKSLYLCDIDDRFNKKVNLDFIPEDIFIENRKNSVRLLISASKNNKIYYTEFPKHQIELDFNQE